MKKILFIAIAMSACGISFGQTPEDALRYSWIPATGTARAQALGSATGAIGGEISTIFSNPANIGFYKTGDLVISGGLNLNKNTGSYYGTSNTANSSSGFLGTSGIVMGKESYRGGSMRSSAFGIAINRTADFNNQIHYKGLNNQSSMATYFIEDIKKFGNRYQFGSDLAYRTYWVDSMGGQLSSPAYGALRSGGLLQEQKITTSGGITDIAIAGAANINDNFYIGGSIGLPTLRYEQSRVFNEADATTNTNGFDAAYFDDHLITKGMGVNVKLGIVVKPVESVRFGLAFHSPTFYNLTDSYTAAAGAATENHPTEDGKNSHDASSQDKLYNNNGVLVSDYRLQTPYRLIGSAAFMFGNVAHVSSQKGFITADVEYVNYMGPKFTAYRNDGSFDRDYYAGLNKAVDNAYKGAVNARLGAELKFNTIMARLGGAYYGNPYKDIAGEKGEILQATGGLGYRNKGFFIDLGYVHTFGNDVVFPYRLTTQPFAPATIKNNNSRLILTLGFKI